MYAGGFNADLVYIAFNSSTDQDTVRHFHGYRSPKLPVVNVIPAQVGSQYLLVKNLTIVYKPWSGGKSFVFDHFLNMINSETYVATNYQYFNQPAVNNLLQVDPALMKQNLSFSPVGWFSGSIVGYKL